MAPIASCVFLLCVASALATSNPLIVNTQEGPVEGYLQNGVRVWRGIPFAAPPTGINRFKPPQPVTPWTQVRKCTTQAEICPQLHTDTPVVLGSEDCLYLDVYVPETADQDHPVAVMIWMFGGGYVLGDGWEFGLYDGMNVARKHNAIIVAMNYRLSALGFMALDQLRNETGTSGNYALQDQLAAMQWVDRNIAAFGGDLSRRMIYGESAGAFSVCWHLVSPTSKGLFQAAIMESGTCDSPQFFREWDHAVEYSEEMASNIGCSNPANIVSCLRAASTSTILNAKLPHAAQWIPSLSPVMPWGPAMDMAPNGLNGMPLALIEAGQWSSVPIIMGTNRNEGTIFLPMMPLIVPGVLIPLDNKTAYLLLEHFYNATVIAKIPEYYPMDQYEGYDDMAASLLRDYFFQCAARRVLRAVTAQNIPAWTYRFTYRNDDPIYPILGDTHAAELKYVFDNPFPKTVPFNARDEQMAQEFGFYWTNMAKSRNPNVGPTGPPPGGIYWPAYNRSAEINIILDVPSSLQADLGGGVCDFWDTVIQVN